MADTLNVDIIMLAVVFTAAILDYRFRKVPNLLTFPAILGGMAIGLMWGGLMGLSFSALGFLVGTVLLIVPYTMGGIGAGDVKLLGAIGAIKGAGFVFVSFLGAAIIGGIMAVARMAFIIKGSDIKVLRQSVKAAYYTGELSTLEIPEYARKEKLPYAVAISVGAVIALFLDTQ